MSAKYPPPEGLSERSAALPDEIVPKRARSAGRIALFEEALRALDRADAARAIVEAEGMTFETKTTKAAHVHPAVKVEREARQAFSRLWAVLYLHGTPEIDGRSNWPDEDDE